MSSQNIAEAFAPVAQRHHEQVMQATWGHLAPAKNRTYKGHIVFAVGCFGNDALNPTILEAEFGDLDGGPWFFNALMEFIREPNCRTAEEYEFEPGAVHRFDGSFRNYEFSGSTRQLEYK